MKKSFFSYWATPFAPASVTRSIHGDVNRRSRSFPNASSSTKKSRIGTSSGFSGVASQEGSIPNNRRSGGNPCGRTYRCEFLLRLRRIYHDRRASNQKVQIGRAHV